MQEQLSNLQTARPPSFTCKNIVAKEEEETRRQMLNEEWSSYAAKNDLSQEVQHVKNTNESWLAYVARKKKQKAFFDQHRRIVINETAHISAAKRQERVQGNAVVEKLVTFDRQRLTKQTPQQHYLFVDFCNYQQHLFVQQRVQLGELESMIRSKLYEGENELLFSIVYMWHADSQLQRIQRRERTREDRVRRQQLELEEQEKIAEARQVEAERAARERQSAEDEKERMEVEKRLERKRREEERRAKARTERDKQIARDSLLENEL